MRTIHTFGFISGVATTVGFLPHTLALTFVLFSSMNAKLAEPLIMFTIGAKALGERLFLGKFFTNRIDSEKNLKNWRLCIKNESFFRQPSLIVASVNILFDAVVDVVLVQMALKSSISATWIIMVLVGCQAFAAPFQGMISDYFGRRKSAVLSMLITGVALIASMELNETSSLSSIINFFGLNQFASTSQILIVLCAKSLLTGNTVIFRAVIADNIQIETKEKFGNV